MKLKVLVNPASGRGRVGRKIDEVLAVLRHGGAQIDVEESRGPEHLTQLGRDASARYDRVVVCGGDGTVHHAVREFDLERGTLAIVPLGSGDDFAATVGTPRDPIRAAAAALTGRVREVDVALANDKRFLIAASVGFDAAVARFASTVTRVRGPAVYLYSVLKVLRQFEPIRLKLNGRDEEMMFVVVANSFRYGGGIRIAPRAAIDDQLLDLYSVSAATRLDLLVTLPLAYFGKHTWRRFVRSERGTHFHIDSDEKLDVFADGEFLTTTPVSIRLESHRLRVVVPRLSS